MISIDTVYQRVLALANKEQRGYITPLEFNLIANQAQQLIFEQYFYDLNQFERAGDENASFSGMQELIKNKLSYFSSIAIVSGGNTFPSNYRTGKIFVGNNEAKLAQRSDILNIGDSMFHNAGLDKDPLYVESRIAGQDIQVFDSLGLVTSNVTVEIISQPEKVEWGYDVIAEKALYNANNTTDFQLHDSEETELVYKILELSGVILNKPGLVQIGDTEDIKKTQQEKA